MLHLFCEYFEQRTRLMTEMQGMLAPLAPVVVVVVVVVVLADLSHQRVV